MDQSQAKFAKSGLPKLAWFALFLCVSLGATLGSCTLIPKVVNARIDKEELALLSTDFAPVGPLTIKDTIGLIIRREGNPGRTGGSCDAMCQHLLLNGIARSVITASSRTDGRAVRWTVEDGSLPCELPESEFSWDTWPRFGFDQSELIANSVAGRCIVSRPSRLGDTQDILELNVLGVETSRAQETDLHPPLVGQQMSLWRRNNAGKLVLAARATWRLPRKLTAWLHKEHNGSVNSPRIQWARLEDHGQAHSEEPAFALTRFISLESEAASSVDTAAVQRGIDAWLDNPNLKSTDFRQFVHTAYLGVLESGHQGPDKFVQGLRLLKDCRAYADIARRLTETYPEQVIAIRDALVERMLGRNLALVNDCIADRELAGLPKGAFASIGPQLTALLKDTTNAPFLKETIVRVSEAGPPAAPMLFELVEVNSFRSRTEYDDANSVARDATGPDNRISEAAINGLCKIEDLPQAYVARLRKALQANPDLNMAISSCQYRVSN
jgi:hypothetical protein